MSQSRAQPVTGKAHLRHTGVRPAGLQATLAPSRDDVGRLLLEHRRCWRCLGSLEHYRRGARTCSNACRMALSRHGPVAWSRAMAACFDIEGRDLWRTPPEVFHYYDRAYGFALDAAACELDHLAPWYIGPDQDALRSSWVEAAGGPGRAAWCNPPYSRRGGGLASWIEKGRLEARAGLDVVMLVPPATDAAYWTQIDLEVHAGRARVDLVRGRLAFRHPVTGKPQDGNRGGSAVLHFWPVRRPQLAGYHPVLASALMEAERRSGPPRLQAITDGWCGGSSS